jgi:hypothetical protein
VTYAVGSIIQAADFNGFAGNVAASSAYASSAAAQDKVSALIGVGYGNRGYGQSSPLAPVTPGSLITASQWNNLRSGMATINTHTGSGLTLQPVVSTGSLIEAQVGTSGRPDIRTLISTLDTNRNNADIGQMAVTSVLTSTRTTAWGNTTLVHEFTVSFGNEDNARYFFNSGGQVRFSASRSGGSSSSTNTSWTTLLNNVGTVKFGYNGTSYTGSGGYANGSIGYFTATGSYQQIFIQYGSGGSYYGNISYSIQVRTEGYSGTNGGNGNLLRFQVLFNDNSSYGYYSGSVDGTLVSQISQYKAVGVLTVSSPTYATVTSI